MNARSNDPLYDFHEYGANLKTREVFLQNYPDNGENPGIEYKCANSFIKNIRALELQNNKNILVHLYSIGGEWNDCMAMFDAVKMCYSPVTMVAYAQAESCSSVILQAAETRLMMPRSYFMAHYGNGYYSGEYQSVHNWSEFEKKVITETMMNIYAERCVDGEYFKEKDYTVSQVKKFLYKKLKDGDWYLTPEETVHYGFADGVLGSKEYPDFTTLISS